MALKKRSSPYHGSTISSLSALPQALACAVILIRNHSSGFGRKSAYGDHSRYGGHAARSTKAPEDVTGVDLFGTNDNARSAVERGWPQSAIPTAWQTIPGAEPPTPIKEAAKLLKLVWSLFWDA